MSLEQQIEYERLHVNPMRRELEAMRRETYPAVARWEMETARENLPILKRNLFRWGRELEKKEDPEIRKRYAAVKRLVSAIEGDFQGTSIEDLKAIPIETVLQSLGIEIKKSFISCPAHTERTASCKIYGETNSFYCFGCHRGGSNIDLVAAAHSCSVGEAIKYLSQMTQ